MEQRLKAPERIPSDNFEAVRKLKVIKIHHLDIKEYNEINEVKLGGCHPNSGL